MQKYWLNMAMQYVGCVSLYLHVAPIFVNSADASAELKRSHFNLAVRSIIIVVISVVSILC